MGSALNHGAEPEMRYNSNEFSFVFCDVALYSPTKALLPQVHSRLAPGGLIVCDEWNHGEFPGEGIAVNGM